MSCVRPTGASARWWCYSSPPRRRCWSGAAFVAGSGADRCLLVVPWWLLGLCRASPGCCGVVVAVGCGLLSLVESVRQEWCFPGESLHRWWQWWRRPRGVVFPAEGTIEGYHVLAARGPRVKTQSAVDVRRWCHWRRALFGGVASGDPSRSMAAVVVGWWCCFVRCGCGGTLGPCWQGGAEGP